MDRRQHRYEFQALLKTICPNVYFDPPENVRMTYPCIVYERSRGNHEYASNKTYRFTDGYSVTIISRDPDDQIRSSLIELPIMQRFDRHYVADGLHHDVFTVFY